MLRIDKALLSFFGIGYLPFSQGTFASIGALCLACLIINPFIYFLVTILVIYYGYVLIKRENLKPTEDPKWIVIDEVGGMLVALMFLPKTVNIILVGFILFRFFDISKVFPIKNMERLHGPLGIMSDDLMAGVISNVIIQIVLRLAPNILV